MLALLELSAGTNVVPATRGEAGQFTTTGQRPNTNYFTVDGASANNGVTAGGLPAQSAGGSLPSLSAFGSMDSLISLDAVQEVRVRTSSSVAEFGRMPGAAISLSSRSGANEFHGSVSYRMRNELVNANDWFANAAAYGPLPLRLHDVAETLGGPVRRNRTFFFLSHQHITLRQPYVWRQPVPSSDARENAADWAQPVISLFPIATGPALGSGVAEWIGRADRPASLSAGGARLDQAIGSRVSLFARYHDSPSANQFGVLAVNQIDLRSQSLTLGLTAQPAGTLVLDTRANQSEVRAHSVWTRDGSAAPDCGLQPLASDFLNAPTPCGYMVRFSIGGIGQLVSGREGDRWQRQFQFLQSASLLTRRHAVGIGVDYRAIVAVRRDPTGTLGVIADAVSGLSNKNSLWISRAVAQNGAVPVHELSLWVQDTWQVGRRIAISAGLRWEFSPAPLSAPNTYFYNPPTDTVFPEQQPLWLTSYGDFAPRLGVALRLTRDGRTVLRAGGGLYYDSSLSIATDTLNGGPLSVSSFTSGRTAPFSANLTFGFMPLLRLPEVRQWNVSLDRALGTQDVISLGYVGSSGRYLIRREVGGAANTPTSLVALTTNRGFSKYSALQLQYRRRVVRGVQATAAYAWSHSIDNDSSDAFLVWAGSNASDRGASDFDLRHSLTASLTYEFPQKGSRLLRGWALDSIFRARSGFPITVLQTENYEGIGLANAFRPGLVYGRPVWIGDPSVPGGRRINPAAFSLTPAGVQGGLGRNAVAGFGMSQFDVALRREFHLRDRARLQFRLEAFNAINHANFADPMRYLNSPVFGQSNAMLSIMLGTGSPGSGLSPILQTGGPRSLQASARFQF